MDSGPTGMLITILYPILSSPERDNYSIQHAKNKSTTHMWITPFDMAYQHGTIDT